MGNVDDMSITRVQFPQLTKGTVEEKTKRTIDMLE